MDRNDRLALIKSMQEARKAKIICYVTGDRENVSTRVAPDILRVFYRHLELIGPQERLELYLYTRGGDVLTPWRLVNLIREYTPYFAVLVPFRAYSAGTLICLGADEIVMGRMGELGPIDPSVTNAFNPQDPNNPLARIPVSVEDVSSYVVLARDRAGLVSEDALARVFTLLSEKVHPLALGNVHRNYALIRLLARKLLSLPARRMPEAEVQDIVNNLTEKLYAHNHMIPRREAREDIHLPIEDAAPDLEAVMWKLFLACEDELKMEEPFDPATILGGERQVDFEVTGGLIESEQAQDAFVFKGNIAQVGMPAEGNNVKVNIVRQGWRPLV